MLPAMLIKLINSYLAFFFNMTTLLTLGYSFALQLPYYRKLMLHEINANFPNSR